MLRLDNWKVANSGVSFDADHIRVRLESSGTVEDRKELVRLLVASPEMLTLLRRIWQSQAIADDTLRSDVGSLIARMFNVAEEVDAHA